LGREAIFFSLSYNKSVFLNDLNCQLIETYKYLKNDVSGIITELKKYKNTENCYYETRRKNYRSGLQRTARFIFLNQTSLNGIYRVTLNGEYNVPYGYRTKDFLILKI